MPFSIRSRALRSLGVALWLAFVTMATAEQVSAQKRSEVRRYGCSLRAAPRAGDADARARRRSRKRPAFSAREALDLEFRARFSLRSTPQASRRIQLKLYTPTGHLYQQLPMTFVDGSSGDEEPTPFHRRRRFQNATAVLPLAGTTIVNHSLYGRWKALAFVEGSHEPCSPPYHFFIEP